MPRKSIGTADSSTRIYDLKKEILYTNYFSFDTGFQTEDTRLQNVAIPPIQVQLNDTEIHPQETDSQQTAVRRGTYNSHPTAS